MTSANVIRIHETDFHPDLQGLRFVQVDNPANSISYFDLEFGRAQETWALRYDTLTKNAFKGSWEEFRSSPTAKIIRIPRIEAFDEEALIRAARYLKQFRSPAPKQSKPKKKRL